MRPGGNASKAVPLSTDARCNAILSSAACWRFKATYNKIKNMKTRKSLPALDQRDKLGVFLILQGDLCRLVQRIVQQQVYR